MSLTVFLALVGITAALIGLGVLEARAHRRRLDAIPIRVHVNGTRGKSSVTRLIAAGLRASGLRTSAKTTGTLARMILPDGRELPVFRPGKPNVIEQVRIVALAAELKSEALVIECMALQPELQWLCENKFVRATHGVITNVRADHLDVMGPGERDVAWALAGMIPPAGKLFTATAKHGDVLAAACADRRARYVTVGPSEFADVTDAEMDRFGYTEHKENVALALRVCGDLGIDRATALSGMWAATPDPGAMTVYKLAFFGRDLVFVNGFAANDPESTETLWRMSLERYGAADGTGGQKRRRAIAVFNLRADRADRSLQLAEAYVRWPRADHVVLIGSGTEVFFKEAVAQGVDPLHMTTAEDGSVEEIFERIVELAGPRALVMGMANIGGPGLALVRHFRNRETMPEIGGGTDAAARPTPVEASIDGSLGV